MDGGCVHVVYGGGAPIGVIYFETIALRLAS